VNSKLIFAQEAQTAIQSKLHWTDLTDDEQKILLMVVDKQLEDCIAVLKAKGKPIVITLNEDLPAVLKMAYQTYCQACGYKLKDSNNKLLVTGKEALSEPGKQTMRQLEEYRTNFSNMLAQEKGSSYSPS